MMELQRSNPLVPSSLCSRFIFFILNCHFARFGVSEPERKNTVDIRSSTYPVCEDSGSNGYIWTRTEIEFNFFFAFGFLPIFRIHSFK